MATALRRHFTLVVSVYGCIVYSGTVEPVLLGPGAVKGWSLT